jgi:GDP-4-dehydro-6-deoxy-D-mannose reductase
MKQVLITGASGFAGRHLISQLKPTLYNIVGTVFGDSGSSLGEHAEAVKLDLSDFEATSALIERVRPDWVFHLAALSSPAASVHDHNKTLINNITAQANLLDALVLHAPDARVLVVGSAEEYGKVDETCLPIDESCPLNPLTPYAVSKIAQDFMGRQYFLSKKLPVVRVRPFNHVGEGQPPLFVLPAFAKQVALIEAGKQEPIMTVGNLDSTRDFTDVRDMVSAYELALIKGEAGDVYNLGSGIETKIADLLTMLLDQATVSIEVKQDPAKMMKADVPRMAANFDKFKALTKWEPTIPLLSTVTRVLDYWRKQVAEET